MGHRPYKLLEGVEPSSVRGKDKPGSHGKQEEG